MISFSQFAQAAPAIADPIAERFRVSGIAMIATLRADGSPRVSPIEVTLHDGGLWVGMMPESRKSADVERDPRCSLVTAVADRNDLGGEGKLFGQLRRERDDLRVAEVLRVALADVEVDPATFAGSPVYELLVSGAAWQGVEGETWTTRSWTRAGGIRLRHREGPTGLPVDVPID